MTRICQLCKKPMLNSWKTTKFDGELELYTHEHCIKEIGCSNCIQIILRNTEGKCICGRTVQLNIDGDHYRILGDFISGRKR